MSLWLVPNLQAEPFSPKDELATFKTLPGFKVELVAAEPDVIDPVAMAFDEKGRLFVCEMRGYPNGGVATGKENRGRIRCLTDENGDGVFEKSVVYADGLRFPTSVMPWKGGVLVANAPDLIYLPDDNNDNKADKTKVLYTGFGLDNIQQILNGFRWGIDNWVYAVNGSVGGTITCPDKPDMKPLVLRGQGIRFKPDVPGSIEPTSGGGQYGLTCDEAQHWFVNTNSSHLRQIVLPDHYLKRNPFFAAPATTVDIPEHGAACKVFRISKFEDWRVERTSRRKDSPDAKRFSPTELVPGGYITSACSPCYYGVNEPLFPERDRGCVYVCDPANNLITRDKLEPNGSIYKGKRIDDGVEFLASTDNWFRPVHLTIGPEGALYVCDFYREVIETPLSLPEDIKKKLNLESRERGRIWRIVPERFSATELPRFHRLSPSELVDVLTAPNEWTRFTAQRLLYEQRAKGIPENLRVGIARADGLGRLGNRLWTMSTFDTITAPDLEYVLEKGNESDKIHALRLAESFLEKGSLALSRKIWQLDDEPSSAVRFQLALTLGSFGSDDGGFQLSLLLAKSDADVWLESAVLSSTKDRDCARRLLDWLANDAKYAKGHPSFLSRLASTVGARGDVSATARVLSLIASLKSPATQSAILEGLGQGARNSGHPLHKVWVDPSGASKRSIEEAMAIFATSARIATDEKSTLSARLAAVRLLSFGPYSTAAEPLTMLLDVRYAGEFQSAALKSLAAFDDPRVADAVLSGWEGYAPTLRREVIEVLFARPDHITKLLDAIEKKKVRASQIEVARADELRKHKDAAIRDRATKLFAGQIAADRKKVIDDYQPALKMNVNMVRGREVFRKNCTACHRLENTGFEVGANLMAALKTKTREALLIDVLDPSREVDPRYVNYQVRTTAGRTVSGLLAVETPTSLTLRRGEKAEDTILRSQIEEIRATSKSLMPEELEKIITREQMADLLEYLLEVVK